MDETRRCRIICIGCCDYRLQGICAILWQKCCSHKACTRLTNAALEQFPLTCHSWTCKSAIVLGSLLMDVGNQVAELPPESMDLGLRQAIYEAL